MEKKIEGVGYYVYVKGCVWWGCHVYVCLLCFQVCLDACAFACVTIIVCVCGLGFVCVFLNVCV